jgi:hypothetical protein
MLKIGEAMPSSENCSMDGDVQVVEFALGGGESNKVEHIYNRKKKKVIATIQHTKDFKMKRIFAMRVEDFSAQTLHHVFMRYISK